MNQLHGRRAVVTGAAKGIGRAIAELYASEGARLILTDRDPTHLGEVVQRCKELGAIDVMECIADVSTVEGAQRGVDKCIDIYQGIDILVNNAGIVTQASCLELTQALWDEMIRCDLTSVFIASQRALPHMIEQRWGRIINISSQLGIKGAYELSHYAAAKAGVIGFTKSLALEVSQHNVLVNSIAPGPITTAATAALSKEWQESKANELPLRRFGNVCEVAPTALFLASDPGGNLFVGQTLSPNSGDVMQ